jgi:DNA-binding transcriptional LysR family regulator
MKEPFGDLRLRELAFFECLATHGSLGAVARELHLPKATASRWLSLLEERVGQPLVKRTTRSVCLTPAGVTFAERVREVLRAAEGARQGVEASASGGLLRVSVPVPMGRLLVGPVIARFRERMPGVQLEVKLQAEPRVDLVRDRFDLVLRGGPQPSSGLKARRLAAATVWAYASARYHEEDPRRVPLLVTPGDELLLKRSGRLAGARPVVRVDDRTALAEALICGAGLGLLPTFLGEPARAQGSLVRLFDAPVAALPIYALFHPAQRGDVRLQGLIDAFAVQLERVM